MTIANGRDYGLNLTNVCCSVRTTIAYDMPYKTMISSISLHPVSCPARATQGAISLRCADVFTASNTCEYVLKGSNTNVNHLRHWNRLCRAGHRHVPGRSGQPCDMCRHCSRENRRSSTRYVTYLRARSGGAGGTQRPRRSSAFHDQLSGRVG